VLLPARTQAVITAQISSRPARTSASGRRAHSLASIRSLTRTPSVRQSPTSSAPVRKGWGTGVGSGRRLGAPLPSSSRTKPPPME
jgi:hypothetical protein